MSNFFFVCAWFDFLPSTMKTKNHNLTTACVRVLTVGFRASHFGHVFFGFFIVDVESILIGAQVSTQINDKKM
jgi:hypothetical protein